MGRCSCAPRKDCKQLQGTCLQSTQPPLKTTKKSTSQSVHDPKMKCIHQLELLKKCRRKKLKFRNCIRKAKRQHRCKGKGRRLRKCIKKHKRVCRKKLKEVRKCRQHQKNDRIFANDLTHPKQNSVKVITTGRNH